LNIAGGGRDVVWPGMRIWRRSRYHAL